MPLPQEAITITGGCNCKAIRYKIQVPPLQDRPLHPTYDPDSGKEPVHLPFACIDHCNDCRRATGALLGVAFCCPTSYITLSLLPSSQSTTTTAPSISLDPDENRTFIPALDVFPPGTGSRENTTLSFYESSPGRTRAFCSHCGTHFLYSAWPYPDGWPRMLDIWIGSVDTEVLEKEWLVPERHLWWDVGIEWVRRFGAEGSGGVAKHPSYKVDREVEEKDVRA